jgi:UDP-N-acetylglucosamine 4,6-dehydratase/5-epimerase
VKIFLTGGTGSLGRALVQFFETRSDVEDVTVYSRDEVKQGEMRRDYPHARYMLGDVRDYDRLLLAMRGHDAVVHAGAYKQVPSAEANVDEAIHTNVIGSMNVARAALHTDVAYVVGVSTDKACMPVNAYGETKALMEKLFQQFDSLPGSTIFNVVRYGNVLGSRGSVVPLFRKQLLENAFTVTDPDMTRFWMTLQDAVNLVWTALSNANVHDGAVLVPRCPASNMMTLLRAVIKVYGGSDAELHTSDVQIIGTRPGEKIHEQLIHRNESMHTLEPNEWVPYYQILPATDEYRAPASFEYYSANARQLTVDEVASMLRADEDA